MKKTKNPKVKLNFESCYNYSKLVKEGLVDKVNDDDDEIVRIHTTHNDGPWIMGDSLFVIETTYCWYIEELEDSFERIVLMYFINGIPFTFDELEDITPSEEDLPRIKIVADYGKRYSSEELYRFYGYLMQEEMHPLVFPIELENPEDLPPDYVEEEKF